VKKIADGSVDWSRFVRRDFDELCMAKQGFDPALVATNLELLVPIYADDQASKLKLQMLINEFHAASRAGTTCGKSEITHLAAKQATGELIGTFIVLNAVGYSANTVSLLAVVIRARQRKTYHA